MITERIGVIAGTLAVLGSVAACSSPPPPPADPRVLLEQVMTSRYPDCAGRVTVADDGGGVCATGRHLYVLYLGRDAADAARFADYARTMHPTGTVDVSGSDVWVIE